MNHKKHRLKKFKINQGKVPSFDGTEIFYQTEGEGSPLVFCYGLVCDASQWHYQTEFFKKTHQVIHFDYRGHNLSSKPKKVENLTIKGCALDLNAVLKALHIEKVVLVGHSMGVNVITQFAALFPKKVSGLIAICGTVNDPFKTMFNTDFSKVGFEFLKLAYLKFPEQFPKIWKRTVPSPLSRLITGLFGFNVLHSKQEDIRAYLNGVSKQHPDTFFYLLQEMHDFKGEKILKKIKVPTLVIGGSQDLITPIRNQYAIYRQLKHHAQFLRVPRGSHCSHLDMPEFINLRMEKFLKDLPCY